MQELKKITDTQDNLAVQSENHSTDLQKKINELQDIEKEIYYT